MVREIVQKGRVYLNYQNRNTWTWFSCNLQETHSDAGNAADWAVESDGLSLLSHTTSISGGVAILFNTSFTPVSYELVEILKGRLLKVRACLENDVLRFICVYAPTKATERLYFLDTLSTILFDCKSEEYLFVVGV